MKIIVRRTKLFDDGNEGEAPVGSTFDFDITENAEFKKLYEHRPKRNWVSYALLLLGRWNRSSPKSWKYTLLEKPNETEN